MIVLFLEQRSRAGHTSLSGLNVSQLVQYLCLSFSSQVCRLQRHLSAGEHQQDLFQSQPAMFVSQHSQPPTQSLVELIQLCGGTVCKTVRQAGICIGKYKGRRPEGSRILSEQWVLGKMLLCLKYSNLCNVTNNCFCDYFTDSITHLKKLPYDNYDLE